MAHGLLVEQDTRGANFWWHPRPVQPPVLVEELNIPVGDDPATASGGRWRQHDLHTASPTFYPSTLLPRPSALLSLRSTNLKNPPHNFDQDIQ